MVFGGDSIWVPSLVVRSSWSSLVVLWGTMVEMVELHVVGWGISYLHPHHRLLRKTRLSWITSLPYYRLILRPHWFGIWTGVLGPWRALDITRMQWAPSNWRTSFKSLILGAICRCCITPNCFHLSWHGRDCYSTWRVLRWMIIMNFGKIMLLRLRSRGNIGLHPMYLLLMVVLLVVVLLHRLLLVQAHRLFPHLRLPYHEVFLEAQEELPRGENGKVEESSGLWAED